MSFFKRKDPNYIPPVENSYSSGGGGRSGNSTSPKPGYRSNASTYVPSRDGDPYATSQYNTARYAPPAPYPDGNSGGDGYDNNNGGPGGYAPRQYGRGPGDVYTRGGADLDRDRNELFSGYDAEKAAARGGSGRFFDGPPGGGRAPPPEGEETEEDVEGIKKDMRWVKQESVNSTRNALRLAREAEETGRNALLRLGDQSEKLANTERHLDVSKGHTARANDHASELKQLNRSIFRPVITFNKDAKRAAAEARLQDRYDEERSEREKAMMDIRESQNRIGRAATYGRDDDDDQAREGLGLGGRTRGQPRTAQQLEQRKRYQFDQTGSDDEIENELDDNLDEIGDMTKRLKALGTAMGQELDNQNIRIDRLGNKVDKTDMDLNTTTRRLHRYGGK